MKSDPRHECEPQTVELSAQELRAYLAEARAGSPTCKENADVDTSMATRLFRPAALAATEPRERSASEATRQHGPRFAPPLHDGSSAAPQAEATRTCFASPAWLARPRIGEAPASSEPVAEPPTVDASTERLTMFEFSALAAPGRAAASESARRRGMSRLARIAPSLPPRARLASLLVVVMAGVMVAGAQLLPSVPMRASSAPHARPKAVQAGMAPAPAAALAALAQLASEPVAGQDPTAPLPSLRRAVDLLLAGHSRDALDAYRALAHSPAASPALREVARLLEHEAKECAAQGGPSCP